VVDTLKAYMFGALRGHSEFNRKIRFNKPLKRENYEEISSEDFLIGEIPAYKFSFTYNNFSDSVTSTLTRGCELLIPVEKGIILVGFYAPDTEFEAYKPDFKNIMNSISIKN
jgi:hypothetical protein